MPLANHWDPIHPLVHKELSIPGQRAVTVSHPQYPFVVEPNKPRIVSDDLTGAARLYLESISVALGLVDSAGAPIELFTAGTTDFASGVGRFGFDWQPFDDGAKEGSFLFTRAAVAEDAVTGMYVRAAGMSENSFVIFLVPTVRVEFDGKKALGSGIGVRILGETKVAAPGQPPVINILGATCTVDFVDTYLRLNPALNELSHYFDPQSGAEGATAVAKTLEDLSIATRDQLAEYLQCDAAELFIDGYRPVPVGSNSLILEVAAHVCRPRAGRPGVANAEPSLNVGAQIAFDRTGPLQVVSARTAPLVADIDAKLFASDVSAWGKAVPAEPVSQYGAKNMDDLKPNRAAEDPDSTLRLEGARHMIGMPGLGAAVPIPLLEEHRERFAVMQSRLGDKDKDKVAHKDADEDAYFVWDSSPAARSGQHSRTHDFAAASAYRQAAELFRKIDGFGLDHKEIFKFAALPLRMRFRSTMLQGPGRDGRVVNAQVDFSRPRTQQGDDGQIGIPFLDPLEVRFGLADMLRSASNREPIGLSVDPRWSWHEFGHVLLAAATGHLELPFAHSVGDALAAIVNDPFSALAADAKRPEWRGATYPWARINRRHDRKVSEGWSWSGSLHQQDRFDPTNSNLRHKGYDSEQILSTSLFRLYRALGGDTVKVVNKQQVADIAARRSAADYTVYLIMRVIMTLGSVKNAPVQTPEGFAEGLRICDAMSALATTGPLKERVGGCALKVVRWAFEAQGLYAQTLTGIENNAPGEPPAVDIFIDNQRPASEGKHPRGGYMPVSLDWRTAKWHATSAAMALDKAGKKLTVTVQNRGKDAARNVNVRAYYMEYDRANLVWIRPGAQNSLWTELPQPSTKDIAGESSVTFDAIDWANTGMDKKKRWLVLAESTCVDDPSITDGSLPCAPGPSRLSWLVAGDNNLGLVLFNNR